MLLPERPSRQSPVALKANPIRARRTLARLPSARRTKVNFLLFLKAFHAWRRRWRRFEGQRSGTA